jgi:hypothetical protein
VKGSLEREDVEPAREVVRRRARDAVELPLEKLEQRTMERLLPGREGHADARHGPGR